VEGMGRERENAGGTYIIFYPQPGTSPAGEVA